MLVVVAPVVAGFLLGSCRTTKSLAITADSFSDHREVSVSILHDSVYLHDSVHVVERGCTLELTRWKVERHVIRDLQRDTIRDTIHAARTEYQVIEKERRYVPKGLKIMLGVLLIPLIFMLYNMFCKISHL